jgi:hypothetical protein
MGLDISGKSSANSVTAPKVRVASDGYPVSKVQSQTWRGICTTCFASTATLTVTKKGTYKVSCAQCKCYLWLNDRISIDLWRGTQALFKNNPEIRELLVTQVSENLPSD